MKRLTVVYHSQSGACAALAAAASEGAACVESVQVSWLRAWDAGTRDIMACDGLILVAAENSGALAGAMKDFLDRCFYPLADRGCVLPVAVVVGAGNDGRGASAQLQRILRGIPFPLATEPLIVRGLPGASALSDCRELGEAFATGIELGLF